MVFLGHMIFTVECLINEHRGFAAIERIEVQAIDSVSQQILTLIDGVFDTGGMYREGIGFQTL